MKHSAWTNFVASGKAHLPKPLKLRTCTERNLDKWIDALCPMCGEHFDFNVSFIEKDGALYHFGCES